MDDRKIKLDYDFETRRCLMTIYLSPTTVITHILSDAEFEREYRLYFMQRKEVNKGDR